MKAFAKFVAALVLAAGWFFTGSAPAAAHSHHCRVIYHHHAWHRHCHCWRHHVRHRCLHKCCNGHYCYSKWRGGRDDFAQGEPNPSGPANPQCKPRIEGRATGQGIFGLGSARARAAAIEDFQSKAASLYGSQYASFARARAVQWDCSKLAIIRAKCVVTAQPCP